MDTTRKASASTITGFLQSEDENAAMPRHEEGKPSQRVQHPGHHPGQHPVHPEQQLYPTPPPHPYYYYPPPLPVVPTMSYAYMDLLKHLHMQNEIRNYLPKFEDSTNEDKSKDCQSKIDYWLHEVQKRECNRSCPNDGPSRGFSHLCVSCEQHFRCSCCSKPLTLDAYKQTSYCQCHVPLQSLMHTHPNQVISCNCACQKQKEISTKQKSKQKSNRNKCNQMCLQSSDHNDVPERDKPHPPKANRNRRKTSARTYVKDATEESSDSDYNCSQQEKGEGYNSDYKSDEERKFGLYVGEGDENKVNSATPNSEVKNNRVRKTRRALAYFINV